MDATAAAAERIRTAIDGEPYGAGGRPRFVEVAAADVVAVAGTVTDPSGVVAALARGAAGAMEGVPADRAGEVRVYQYAHQLDELLRLAGV